MWTVIYMDKDKASVEKMRSLLEEGSIITRVRALKKSDESYCYELLVPYAEVCPAHSMMLDAEF